jgi:hypothetical protein
VERVRQRGFVSPLSRFDFFYFMYADFKDKLHEQALTIQKIRNAA